MIDEFGHAKERAQTAEADQPVRGFFDCRPPAKPVLLPMSDNTDKRTLGFFPRCRLPVADVFENFGIAKDVRVKIIEVVGLELS